MTCIFTRAQPREDWHIDPNGTELMTKLLKGNTNGWILNLNELIKVKRFACDADSTWCWSCRDSLNGGGGMDPVILERG